MASPLFWKAARHLADGSLCRVLEQFQEKCAAVFRPELRKNKWIERFGDSMNR
jgi:hypothetical protein